MTTTERQYRALKRQHPEAVVFVRSGAYYQTYGEDAVKARAMFHHATVPVADAERLANQLVGHGLTVIMADQLEEQS